MDNETPAPVPRPDGECRGKAGPLPSCAPLASSWTPVQPGADNRYSAQDGLTRGTIFPCLELPFLNTVNRTNPYAGTPMGDVMGLKFAVKELQLYLDTHQDDGEAFELLKDVMKLCRQAEDAYVRRYGPLEFADMESQETYTWVQGPWPWKYGERQADN